MLPEQDKGITCIDRQERPEEHQADPKVKQLIEEERLLAAFTSYQSLFGLLPNYDENDFYTNIAKANYRTEKIDFARSIEKILMNEDVPLDELFMDIIVFKQKKKISRPISLIRNDRKPASKAPAAQRAYELIEATYQTLTK